MVKNAKRRVKTKGSKRSEGRVKAKVKRVAKAKAKVVRKAKRAALAPRMRRPLPLQAQAVGSLVVGTALEVANAIGDVPVEQVAMDCASGLSPAEEKDALNALDEDDAMAEAEAEALLSADPDDIGDPSNDFR